MHPEDPIHSKTAADLLFREEILCELLGNQHLTTRINFSSPEPELLQRCRAEMHLEELDLHVHLQHPHDATELDEVLDCRMALGELLIEKMLAELQTAQTHFSNLELVTFDGARPVHPVQLVSGSAKNAGGYLPTANRKAGGYLPAASRNAGGYLPATNRNAGHYLRSAAQSQLHGKPVIPTDQVTIRTNYSLIEQYASRLLQLKEAIRGMVNLQHQRQ